MPGNEVSFRDQLVELLPRLRRFGFQLTGSQEACEDLVQSTCERALSRRAQWRADNGLQSWTFAIMHSLWKNQLRAQQVRNGNGQLGAEGYLKQDGVRSMETRMMVNDLTKAAKALPPDQRAALYLVYVEGYAYQEAAEMLDLPLGTVMSRLARARLALSDHLTGRKKASYPPCPEGTTRGRML